MVISILSCIAIVPVAAAASADEIDTTADGTLAEFEKQVPGGTEFLNKAKGVQVFPDVLKGGFIIGGEYRAGVMRISGKTVRY